MTLQLQGRSFASESFDRPADPETPLPRLSVIIPVFNEASTLAEVIDRVLSLDLGVDIEVLAIDDGSSDGSVEILRSIPDPRLVVAHHPTNRGKGAAIRTGLNSASGEIVVIQDADLEYDPAQWEVLLRPILDGDADVVYGSRFLGDSEGMRWSNRVANRALSALTGLLYGAKITDMETCYKLIRLELLDDIDLEANRFDFEPEITARLLRRGIEIAELPIGYEARSHEHGKKIGWIDGVAAIRTLIKWRLRRKP